MSRSDANPNVEYKVKIFGCTTKEITVKQQKITVKEISVLAGLPADTLYKVDGHIASPQTELTLYEGIELECGDFKESTNLNVEYKVKIFGCTTKEITVKQQKITVKEISVLAGLPADTLYKVDGHIASPQTELTLYEGIELECGDFKESTNLNVEYKVKIFGCTTKEITVKQQKITVKEISVLAGLPADTLYKVDGHIASPQTELTLYEGIELECGDFGGAS